MNEITRIPQWTDRSFDGMPAWFAEMSVTDFLFHPNDDPSEIISTPNWTKPFSDTEAAELRTIIAEMFDLKGDEVYEAGLPISRAAPGQFNV